MALRFKSEFRNIRRELFKIEIHDSEFSGVATDFVVRNNGLQLQYTGGDKSYHLIKSSNLRFIMSVDNSTLKAFVTDLADADNDRFVVKAFLDETYSSFQDPEYTPDGTNYNLYWLGFINKKLVTREDGPYPFDFAIAAVDGIENLKTIDFKDDDGDVFEGRISIIDFLSKILDKIDVGGEMSSSDHILGTRVNWFESNVHIASDDVCVKTLLYQDPFSTIDNNNQAKFSTYYEVLDAITKLFQCRFLHNRGKYWFTQFHRIEDNNTYFLYRKDGTTDLSTTSIPTNGILGEYPGYNTSSPTTGKPGFFQRTKTYGGKLSSCKIRWNSLDESDGGDGITGDLYPMNYFPIWTVPNSGWIPFGQDINGPNLLGYFTASQDISFKVKFVFSIKVKRTPSVAAVNCDTPLPADNFYGRVVMPFWLKAPSSDGVMSSNAFFQRDDPVYPMDSSDPTPTIGTTGSSWVTSNDDTSLDNAVTFKTPPILLQTSSESETEYHFETNLYSDSCPVLEASGVHIYNDYDGNWSSNYSNDQMTGGNNWFGIESVDGTTIWDRDSFVGYTVEPTLTSIEVYAYEDGEPFSGSVVDSYVSEDSQASGNPEELVIDNILFGDGPNINPLKSIWVLDGANLVQSQVWKVDAVGNAYKIHKLITDEILNYNYRPLEVLNCKLISPPQRYDNQPTYVAGGFNRTYVDEDGVSVFGEIYAFNTLTYLANKGEWSFTGQKIAPITAPTIVTDDDPNYPDPSGGYEGGEIVTGDGGELGLINLVNLDSFGSLNENLSPLDTNTTSITVTGDGGGLVSDIPVSAKIIIQSNSPDRSYEFITLSVAASKGDTSLSINSWTPSNTYSVGNKLILSRLAIADNLGGGGGGTPAGTTRQVQFNDSGSFGAESGFEYDKTTDILTSTYVDSHYLGNNIGTIYDLYIYLTPLDFNISSGYRNPPYTDDDGATLRPSSSGINYYASIQVPLGYKAVKVDLSSSSNDSFWVGSSSWNSSSIGTNGSGTTNSTLTLSPSFPGYAGKYMVIKFDPSSTNDEIYGCRITLDRV